MIGHLDCSTGVSGDKFLGAVLDAGSASGAFTAKDLQAIVSVLAPEARVVVEDRRSHGISAVGVRVESIGVPGSRNWRDIRQAIIGAALPDAVRERSLSAFELLAGVEAAIHGTSVDDVHFHEVGGLDSIMDVVGVCAGLSALGVERLHSTPVATGWGNVATSHGVLPVPAPATAALLVGVPVVAGPARPEGSAPGELTTPTGAALLRATVDAYQPLPPCVPRAIGYGAGTRDIGAPNVCRLILGDPAEEPSTISERPVSLIETNLDHLSAEAVAFAAEELLAEGALDVWQAPIVMKKGRLAVMLSVLVDERDADRFAERTIALTGTLGVRRSALPRLEVAREVREIATPFGPVRFKIGAGVARPEHEDVARIARENGLPYGQVLLELAELA